MNKKLMHSSLQADSILRMEPWQIIKHLCNTYELSVQTYHNSISLYQQFIESRQQNINKNNQISRSQGKVSTKKKVKPLAEWPKDQIYLETSNCLKHKNIIRNSSSQEDAKKYMLDKDKKDKQNVSNKCLRNHKIAKSKINIEQLFVHQNQVNPVKIANKQKAEIRLNKQNINILKKVSINSENKQHISINEMQCESIWSLQTKMEICLACVSISMKLFQRQSQKIRLSTLASGLCQTSSVIFWEQRISKQLKWKLHRNLLIQDCLQVAYKWDQFIHGISCVETHFFDQKGGSPQNIYFKQVKNPTFQASEISYFQQDFDSQFCESDRSYIKSGIQLMKEICEIISISNKMVHLTDNQRNLLSIAVIAFCVKQTQRENEFINSEVKRISERIRHKSNSKNKLIDLIISDFVSEAFKMNFPNDFKDEICLLQDCLFSFNDSLAQDSSILSFKNMPSIKSFSTKATPKSIIA